MNVIAVNDANFEREVIASELPVLIDLYADWCEPCKQIAPIVAELSVELAGSLKVVKIDVEQSPQVAQMFRVQSIPMLVVMHQGRPVAAEQGALNKEQMLQMLEPFLPKSASVVEPKELAQLLQQRRALPVDVRDAGSFGRFHVPGAINIPSEDIDARVQDLIPNDGRIRILYGRTEDASKEIAQRLEKQGVQVGYLAGGFLHWEADGFEVERG